MEEEKEEEEEEEGREDILKRDAEERDTEGERYNNMCCCSLQVPLSMASIQGGDEKTRA